MRLFPFGFLVMGTFWLLSGCAGAPPTPTAQQYFNDVKNNLNSSDYDAALKNLDRLIKSAGEQPLGLQGTVLRAVLLTAMAEGSKQMAEAYAVGVKQPAAQAHPGAFSKMRADYYGMARVWLMNAMEGVMGQRGKLTEQPIPLDIAFPEFRGTEPTAFAQIKNGYGVQEAERYRAQIEEMRNALARRLAALVGAGEDVNKGQAIFSKGGAQIDPRLYLIEMSDAFLRLSEIFGPRALDDPRYRRASLEVVRDNMDVALKLLSAKPDKSLEARAKKMKAECEKQLKALGA